MSRNLALPPARGVAPALLSLLAVLLAGAVAPAAEPPKTERDLAYAPGAGRSLDLYLPAGGREAPPLLVWVYSRFWSRADGLRRLAIATARPLQRDGVAVAVVRHRLSPEHRHPAHCEDVAQAVAWLLERADRYGYDPDRIYLAGHGSGAQLAALVALDPRYLAAHGVSPRQLAGIVALSGVYDLDPDDGAAVSPEERELYRSAFGASRTRREASPIRHVRADAPPLLALAAQNDIPGYAEAAGELASALREAGQPEAEAWVVPGRDHMTILDWTQPGNTARSHVLAFVGRAPLPPELAALAAALRYWRSPAWSSEPFWELERLVDSRPVDDRLRSDLRRIFEGFREKARSFDAERYHAIDLFDFLEARGAELRKGRHLVLENVRGEQWVLGPEALRRSRPVLVIGLDERRNLFQIVDFYRRRASTAAPASSPSPFLARPLGAFLHFREEPPPALDPYGFARYGLVIESLRVVEEDPLAPLRDLPAPVLEALTGAPACLGCHSLRGVGGRATHLRAEDGRPYTGARPLADYPAEVLGQLLRDPQGVAAALGGPPKPALDPELIPALEAVVARER